MHGDKDTILPFSYCETMYSKALPPKQMYTCHGEGHNDIGLINAAGYVGASEAVCQSALESPSSESIGE
jgi:fermentation-respiration switch protein FrsA (DUF1100 family)